jgi:hypothetical protein
VEEDEVVQRIGELINATDVETVLNGLAQWLTNYDETIRRIDPDNVTCRNYRVVAVKLAHLAEEI